MLGGRYDPFKKGIRLLLIIELIFTLLLFWLSQDAFATKSAKKVKLNKTKVTLYVGKTVKLKATVKPKGANKKVKWKSSKKKVATVNSKGKVKAISAGKTTITCISAKNKKVKAKCRITVRKKLLHCPPISERLRLSRHLRTLRNLKQQK